MAYTKILVIHNRLDKCLDYAQDKEKTSLSLAEAIDYALNRDKTEQACFETGINCDVEAAWRDMLSTKRRWGKAQRKRQGYHIIQSFAPGEVTPEEAHAAGVEFAQRLFGERYEAIVTTHLNKAHLHNHVVVNSVSMLDGTMYRDTFQEYYGGDGAGIRGTSDAICQEHGLSVIEPDPENPDRRRSRPEWEGRTVAELAEELGLSPVDTVMHVLSACEGSVACIYFCINEDDMLNIMRDMRIALGSDGYGFSYDRSITRTNPHPRSFGTFPRFLELARDHRLMPLEDAVYKITGLPADILGLKDRGTLEEGRIADITVFDPEQVRDLSEYTDSVKKPAGIRHVLVGGTFALKDGAATGSRTGTVLKKG